MKYNEFRERAIKLYPADLTHIRTETRNARGGMTEEKKLNKLGVSKFGNKTTTTPPPLFKYIRSIIQYHLADSHLLTL